MSSRSWQRAADASGEDYRHRYPGTYDIEAQRQLVVEMLTPLGYDPEAFRIDTTAHPFASRGGTQDIRLTTRYHLEDLSAVFSSLHECGHGLYEHGIDPKLERTPLCNGVSMSLHESQSRMVENVIGRSLPFWTHWFTRTKAAFPGPLAQRRARRLLPRRQRGEALADPHRRGRGDLQPPHHPALRARAGHPRAARRAPDLPEIWNERMKAYLGIDVPDDARGVLQDVHWSGGGFGYFPTYALGNLVWRSSGRSSRATSPMSTSRSRMPSSARSPTGCGRTSGSTDASTRLSRRCAAPSAARSTRSRTCATSKRRSPRSAPRSARYEQASPSQQPSLKRHTGHCHV